MNKNNIKDFTLEQLKEEMVKLKEPRYRAVQIFFWFYQKGASDFNEMSNIPKDLIDKLEQNYCASGLELFKHFSSMDKTEKFLFKLSDGNFIETVLIYTKYRKTICLSTQVGCKFKCLFCASGLKGFIRNLTPSEIANQILYLQHTLKHKITNYVFMGMGEPLDNYENVVKAIMIMNDHNGMNIGARRITVSTCGIVPGIEKLKNFKLQVNLSISLHAANNKLRDELMPINKKYPLEKLVTACEDFVDKKRMLTLEYILIRGKNDSRQSADELSSVAKRLKAKVNLIAYNIIPDFNLQSPRKQNIDIFMDRLINNGVNVTLRESKGEDIQAACGQLAGIAREQNKKAAF